MLLDLIGVPLAGVLATPAMTFAAECLLVEMGAPPGPDDTLDPDVLTYGASAAIGRALVGLIETGRANRGAR